MSDSSLYPVFRDVVVNRYSCRKFTPQPVSRETILTVMEAAGLAPSACNRQPWKFVIVDTDSPLRKAILEAYDRPWLQDIPVFIIACGIHSGAWHRNDGKDHTDIDVAIAVEHICLAATSLGLATCWICNFDVRHMSEALSLTDDVEPIAILPLGYAIPDAQVPAKVRKPLEEIVSWGKF